MPPQFSPRRTLRSVSESVDWSAVRKTVLDAAVAAGFATTSRNGIPPLFPGLRVPNLTDALASRIADRVVDTITLDEDSVHLDEEPLEATQSFAAGPPAATAQ